MPGFPDIPREGFPIGAGPSALIMLCHLSRMSLRFRGVILVAAVLPSSILMGALVAGYQAKQALSAGLTGAEQTAKRTFEDLLNSDHPEREARNLVLAITDNGVESGDQPNGQGIGLIGMRERIASLGGSLAFGPADDKGGWSVDARLPIDVSPLRSGITAALK
jgi:signal transduction histidine kinase